MARALELNTEPTIGLMEHMLALDINGYWMLPLGKGKDGKEPRARFKDRNAMPLGTIRTIMTQKQSSMFGVRCAGLVVVDVDTMTDETLAYCELRFPPSPFTVKTRKGEHRYYRSGDKPPGNIVTDEMHIDIKHGKNMFVVGPGRVRPDTGDEYRMNGEPLPPISELPIFRDWGPETAPINKPRPAATPKAPAEKTSVEFDARGVSVGQRNFHLCRKAVAFAVHTASPDTLFQELSDYARVVFSTMDDFGPTEIQKITRWAWGLRRDNKIKSQTRNREHDERMVFAAVKHGGDGYLLTQHLQYCHGAQPGKRFAICREAMARANTLPTWSEWNYSRARDAALKVGRIVLVHKGGKLKGDPNLYQLSYLPTDSGAAEREV